MLDRDVFIERSHLVSSKAPFLKNGAGNKARDPISSCCAYTRDKSREFVSVFNHNLTPQLMKRLASSRIKQFQSQNTGQRWNESFPKSRERDPGVVANFAPIAGTGAGRRVQDMSELEIFG